MSHASETPPADEHARLRDTRDAFDSVSADYDGERGNNELIQEMRAEMWRWLDESFAPGSRLIDLGCGTGLDAVRMARAGHRVTATDWSAKMIERTAERAAADGVAERVGALAIGAHELEKLPGDREYDGAYSDLGPLNCVPDLDAVARECARLLRPGGSLVFTVIGRVCPWELALYIARGQFSRAAIRFRRGVVPVPLEGRTVWTQYFNPREFERIFAAAGLTRVSLRALGLFVPPPYLQAFADRHPAFVAGLQRAEDRYGAWPLLRSCGDHFLVVLRKA